MKWIKFGAGYWLWEWSKGIDVGVICEIKLMRFERLLDVKDKEETWIKGDYGI